LKREYPKGEHDIMAYRYSTLLITVRDGVATLRMNRPETRNAFEHQLREDLIDCLRRLAEDEQVRVIVLTGSGKAFSAGGDLREIGKGMTLTQAKAYMEDVTQIIPILWHLDKPVIAAVNGAAYGAGFSIAMACDLVVASEEATFSLAFVKVALVPDLCATYFLPRLIGLQRTKEWVFTGNTLPARELLKLGVINDVVSAEKLDEHVSELASQIAVGPPLALASAKRLLNQSFNLDLSEALRVENETQAQCLASKDHGEGVTAFYEKRPPRFTGK
jgi:2-(1,2-epoxy-1,2-dihydrophenyl)acetyl-CoA isomerase